MSRGPRRGGNASVGALANGATINFFDGATDPALTETVNEGDRWDEWGTAPPPGAQVDPETLQLFAATVAENQLAFALPRNIDWSFRRKTIDQTLTGATNANYVTITELDNPLEAGHLYVLFAVLFCRNGTGEDMRLEPVLPAGATIFGANQGPNIGAGSATASQKNWAAWQGTDNARYDVGLTGATTADLLAINPVGLVVVGATAGTLTWRARLVATDTNEVPIIGANSFVVLLDPTGAD